MFFGAAIFQKCCRGVGEQPTFAEQIIFVNRFSCCNCPVALLEFTGLILMIQLCLNLKALKNAIAAGKPICKIQFASQMWAARPHLGSIFVKLLHRKTFQNSTAFSVKIFRCNCSTGTVTNYLFTAPVHKAERSCSPRLEKLSLFSPPPPCAKSMAQEFRCLRAAIRATRPEPRQHF